MSRRSNTKTHGESAFETLRRFDYHVGELSERRLLQRGNLNTNLRLRQLPGGKFEIAIRSVDEEDLRSLVMAIRLFIAEGQPTHLDRVFNVAYQHITDETLIAELIDAREQWQTNWRTEGVVRFMQEGGPNYTAPEVLNLWINGRWFHPDDDASAELDALGDQRGMMLWMVIAAAEAAAASVLRTGLIVRKALRDGLVSSAPVRTGRPRRKAA